MSTAAPGWHPDPQNPAQLRYWDGASWTDHVAPMPTATPTPVHAAYATPQQQPPTKNKKKTAWIIVLAVGLPLLLVGAGLVAAIVIPIFLSQQQQAQDLSARSDVAALGKEVAVWFVDHNEPPLLTSSNGEYLLDGYSVASVSDGVKLGGLNATNATDWCVWVAVDGGSEDAYQYSAMGGLAIGDCTVS